MSQEVKYINVKDLVLWTENPRDPINADAVDQDIINKALGEASSKWSLASLAREMGPFYDFSELPTVVYHNGRPVVYDGNRRMILGKIKLGLVTPPPNSSLVSIPEFPEDIPCNVCSEDIALQNIYRKHSGTGSWLPLERDIFLHKFMEKEKSTFLVLDESTSIISAHPHLNQGFVRDEIFKEENLRRMGFSTQNGVLNSRHTEEEALAILQDISSKIEDKTITTRKNRGKVIEVLNPSTQEVIYNNKANDLRPYSTTKKSTTKDRPLNQRQTRRTKKKADEIFGGKLYLKIGDTSNLYRDITDLYEFYTLKKDKLSSSFPSLIRMSLRLLCEAAAKDENQKMDAYIKGNFDAAKRQLSQDIRTTLANHNVAESSIIQLLHTGAHNYQSSSNMEQTIAVSIIVGAILTMTHGQE
jgi:hypothetical protein